MQEEEEEDEEEEEEEEEQNEQQQQTTNSITTVVLCFFFGYIISVAGALSFAPSDIHQAPSQTLFIAVCLLAAAAYLCLLVLASRSWQGDNALAGLPLGI